MTTPRPTDKPLISTEGRLVCVAIVAIGGALALYHWIYQLTHSIALAASIALLSTGVFSVLCVSKVFRPHSSRIRALIDSADSLRDADFSFTIAEKHDDEIGELITAYNQMVSTLRAERQNLHQRELMLDTVLQASPLALVLCNDNDQVIYANGTARELFYRGKRFAGMKFVAQVIAGIPTSLRDAITAGSDAMVSVDGESESERYHLSCSDFSLNARRHRLYLLKRLTHELNRQEVATWKKVIRLIGHELNNSLAPISSMAHSGALLLEREQYEKLPGLLKTIEQRSSHLKAFIESYSRFAKLPSPRLEVISWDDFLAPLAGLQNVQYMPVGAAASGVADRQQLEQVIINLIKNALESDSDRQDITLTVKQHTSGWQLSISDRGRGMSDESLASALLPFYSTKKSGSGLGLSLCREIVDAHDGRIGLHNRQGGGLVVKVWLPQPSGQVSAT